MGLFDKKYCDICGEKIGLLGNRKLSDGNLCKDCAAKLSPWFTERKQSTVEEIREQLRLREENRQKLAGFHPTRTIGVDTKVCGNVSEDYTRDKMDSQLKNELLTALQPAFAKIGESGIRYFQLPGHTMELADALNQRDGQRGGRTDHEGAAAQCGLHGSHPGGGPSGGRPG